MVRGCHTARTLLCVLREGFNMTGILLDNVCPECGTEEAAEPGADHCCPDCGREMI